MKDDELAVLAQVRDILAQIARWLATGRMARRRWQR